jgi:hypothetical protein
LSEEIKLTREETETHINFTHQDRIDGVIWVYTEDPVIIRRCEELDGFKDMGADYGVNLPSRLFRSENGDVTVSFRAKRKVSLEERKRLAEQLNRARNERREMQRK